MKMQATINSEQGKEVSRCGDDVLNIEVKGENRKTFLELKIKVTNEGYLIEGYVIHPESTAGRRGEQYFRYEVTKAKKTP